MPKMLSQFSAVYSQLFCCDCPGALQNVKCDNKTGVVIAYPVLAQSNYSWLAGLICLCLLTAATVVAVVLYCRNKRRGREADLINIIRFQDNLRTGDDLEQQSRCLVNSTYKNPGFSDTEQVIVTGRLALTTSASEESLDSPLLCHIDCQDDDVTNTHTFPLPTCYDSS